MEKVQTTCESLRQRTMKDIFSEIGYVEDNCEALRQEALKSLRHLDEPLDKYYMNEKIIKIQNVIPELLRLVAVSD